ncbi:MAG: prephenate dehydrogenase [Candidatus Omnitrophica bacterium]|nr:prephenate dehydrogenase [Candidatus Omnitrophota bacterium]
MKKKRTGNNDIVIVGLGLMGASLALALQKKMPRGGIVALSRNTRKIKDAVKKRIIGRGTSDPATAFARAAIIIIATPVRTIQRYITLAEKHAPCGTLVTDVGSTKKELVEWADKKKFKNIRFIGSHPLAGSDRSGMHNAVGDLYEREICFVTPGRQTSIVHVRKVNAFWKSVGARVIVIAPALHDKLLAASSHYPHLLAYALMNCMDRTSKTALKYVGAGFKDTTRIAASAPDIWYDIIVSNKKNIVRKNKEMIDELKRVHALIQRADKHAIKQYLTRAKRLRDFL